MPDRVRNQWRVIVRHYLIKIERMEQLRSMMRLDPTSVECRSGVVTPRPHFQSTQELTIVNGVLAFLCFNAWNDAQLQAGPGSELTGEGSKMKSAPLGDHNRRHFLRALGSTFVAAGAEHQSIADQRSPELMSCLEGVS